MTARTGSHRIELRCVELCGIELKPGGSESTGAVFDSHSYDLTPNATAGTVAYTYCIAARELAGNTTASQSTTG